MKALRDLARKSILDINDGITSAAGVAEGFITAGASTRTLLFAGTAVILAGGSAAAGARYSEERTEWEMNRALLEAERASIEADPAGEFEELVGISEAKGLNPGLAHQVAEALTERDPVAACPAAPAGALVTRIAVFQMSGKTEPAEAGHGRAI